MRFKINESITSSGLPNVMFGDNIVGNSTPSKDKINPELLKDISNAAKKTGVEVTITTAVTGHKKGTRHETGNAIDIAIVNGKGFSGGEQDAKKKGIYDAIQDFVDELISMGYKKNVEVGNDKAVLTFGFPGHHNHIHISRKSGGSNDDVTIDKMTKDLNIPDESELTISDISGSSTMKRRGTPLKNDKYFVLHHTAGRGTPKDVVNILNSRGLGIQWVIDRDGKLYKTLPSGSLGYHVVPNKPGAPKDLSNQTAQGVEIIGSNDNDILEKQCVTALKLIKKLGYPLSNIYGHGELQSNKMSTEGQKCKKFIITNFDKAGDFTFSNSEEETPTDKSKTQTQQTQQIRQDNDDYEFSDLLKSNIQNREEKYNKLFKKYFGENTDYGLKKRSFKLNEEISRMRKLF